MIATTTPPGPEITARGPKPRPGRLFTLEEAGFAQEAARATATAADQAKDVEAVR